MVTKTYYLPQGQFALHLLNHIVNRVECSIGDLKVLRDAGMIRVPLTCKEKDVPHVEHILSTYGCLDS